MIYSYIKIHCMFLDFKCLFYHFRIEVQYHNLIVDLDLEVDLDKNLEVIQDQGAGQGMSHSSYFQIITFPLKSFFFFFFF